MDCINLDVDCISTECLKYLFCSESCNFWPALTAIIAGIVAFHGIKAFRFNVWLKAQEIFTEKKFVEARTIVYELDGDRFSKWSNGDTDKAKLVCRKMDELAWLVRYLGKKKFLEAWGNQYAKLWKVLKKFVYDERDQIRWEKQKKWSAFEKMGEKAKPS